MIDRVQNLIRRIGNELKALKMRSPMSIGALRFPETTPSQSYQGSINTSSQDLVVARLAASFTRADGETMSPMVDFAFNVSVSPTYTQYMATQGVTITGDDPNVMTEFYVQGYVHSATDGSVTYYIDVLNAIAPYAGSAATINVSVEALSTVEGTLTLERIK